MSYWHTPLVLTRPYKPLGLALILNFIFISIFRIFGTASALWKSSEKEKVN
jgi:hypothetical protein